MKTSELTGTALDWAVTTAERYDSEFDSDEPSPIWGMWGWATDWAQGGPIIEREMITLEWTGEDWVSYIGRNAKFFDPKPLVAAMRCHVASQLGDEIEIPKELL